jgi:hypothetical protein
VDLERRFYLLAGLAAWQPAGTPLGGGVSAFTRSFGQRTGSTVASPEHALPEKRVADGQEDEDRVSYEGKGYGPPDQGKREEDAANQNHEQVHRAKKGGPGYPPSLLGRERSPGTV